MSSSRAATPGQVLFAQPSYMNGIAPNFSVTGGYPAYAPTAKFYLHANQPNPFAKNSNFVPVHWNAGPLTGLYVPRPANHWQQGIWVPEYHTAVGHTVAQLYGPVAAAFLNSADLIAGSPGNRMMIAPLYNFPAGVMPFTASSSVLGVAFDLQVPTATDEGVPGLSNAYVKLDLLFTDPVGGRMSLSCGVFANGVVTKGDGAGFDSLTDTAIAMAVVSPLGKLVTLQPGSAVFQSEPWQYWLPYNFTVSYAQFARAIAYANPQAKLNGYTLPSDPAEYTMTQLHLNAEVHYTSTLPSTLGWSMQGLTITQVA